VARTSSTMISQCNQVQVRKDARSESRRFSSTHSSCFDEVLNLIYSATQVDSRSLLSCKIKVLPETFARRRMAFLTEMLRQSGSPSGLRCKGELLIWVGSARQSLIPHHCLHDFPIHDALDVSLADELEFVPLVSAAPKCEGQ
jgi:hypothetical protein